jgi:hypothetical protein
MESRDPVARLIAWIFASFGAFWLAAVILSCISSAAIFCGVGYAIYWGLSLAERAVEVQESGRGSVESQSEAPASRP